MATASDPAAPAAVDPTALPSDAGMGDLAVSRWDPGAEEPSKSDRYLARRLAAASADYKSVACTTFLLGAAVTGGAWLALGILAEHWLVPGGLSPTVRWAWLGVALVALSAAAVRWLVPLVRYRVNLVYAARAIEREHPELHNDLVNTVLVKAHPESNPAKVVRSLERRTAKQLSEVPVEAVIDRTIPLRLAWALAALVGLAGLYELAAPKSLLVSAVRLLAPWAGWAAPSRVQIGPPRLAWLMPAEQGEAADALDRRGLAIEAGAATLVRGRQLVVAADIRGLRRGERPEVVVAPLRADGAVDTTAPAWSAELVRTQGASGADRLFVAVLPDATRGLDQSVEITIAAGDARSQPVRVAVVDSPTLLVREIRYAFPAYTRRAPETVAWQGDIRGLEGTEVTVVAESNQPLEDAWIDFDADGNRDLKFAKSASDHARVTKTFQLRLKDDGTRSEHASYRLLFQPRSAGPVGREQVITDPLEHRIEVIADVAPEVAIDEPRESPLRVPPAAPVTVRVQAHDPDFALARVGIETRLQGGAAGPEIAVLEKEHAGVFRGAAQLVPERLGAGPGAVLEYRAVAIDNRPKQPNVSHSPWQALKIDPSAPPRQPEPPPSGRQPADGDPSQGQGDEEGKGGEQGQAGDGRDTRDTKDGPRGAKQQDQAGAKQQRDQPQPGNEKQQGKQDGEAQGAQGGDRQQQPDKGKQAGSQQGEGQNQGQGAERGQGLGAQGERQGGAEQQAGKQQQGGKQQDGRNDRGQQEGQQDGRPQAGQQRGNDGKQASGVRDNAVAADGTNDGEAMERILDHRREQGEKQGGNGGEKQGEQQGEQQGDGAKQQRDRVEPGESGKQPDGDHEHAPCNRADGKPCGKEGCPTCQGQGGGGQAGGGGKPGAAAAGGEKDAGGDKKDGSGAAEADGEQGAGTEGAGEKGAGKEGAGQAGAGKEGAGKEGAGKQGAGKEAAGQAGTGKQGAGKGAGAGGDDAGEPSTNGEREGAPGDGQQAGGAKQGSREGPGQEARDQRAGSKPGAQPGAGDKQAAAGDKAAPQPGEAGSGAGQTGSGGWAGGDAARRPDGAPMPDGPAPAKETEWGEQDLAHTRNAANLALEHLRRAVEAGDTEVLDRLGWTRDQARAFLERWEKMRRLAESADPVERGAFERTMRSLGLRPDGVRSSRDVPADARGGQAEGRRSRPPADYQEQVKAYTQGTSGE
ncbi:MAG: hypothetical protein ACKOBP_04375 [Planctomycetia bacterium]